MATIHGPVQRHDFSDVQNQIEHEINSWDIKYPVDKTIAGNGIDHAAINLILSFEDPDILVEANEYERLFRLSTVPSRKIIFSILDQDGIHSAKTVTSTVDDGLLEKFSKMVGSTRDGKLLKIKSKVVCTHHELRIMEYQTMLSCLMKIEVRGRILKSALSYLNVAI